MTSKVSLFGNKKVRLGLTIGSSLLIGGALVLAMKPGNENSFGRVAVNNVVAAGVGSANASDAEDEQIIATVNGTPVSQQELNLFGANRNLSRAELIDEWISVTAMAMAAERQGMDKSGEIAGELRYMERQLLANAWLRRQSEAAPIDEDDVKAEYEQLVADKTQFDRYHVEVLNGSRSELFAALETLSGSDSAAKKKLDWQPIRVRGADGETSEEGLMLSAMPPLFAAVVSRLEVGAHTPTPISSGGNQFVVLRLKEKVAGDAPAYEEVKDEVRAVLRQRQIGQFIQQARNQVEIGLK